VEKTGMSESVWDVVVVGAGPAGSVLAREIVRLAPRKVLLLDQAIFPRQKVCGCCLNRNALAALDSVGLGALPNRLGGVPLETVTIGAGGRRATVHLPGGISLSRDAFDVALIEAAQALGVEVRTGQRVTLEPEGTDRLQHRTLTIRPVSSQPLFEKMDSTVLAKVVIDATGLNGRLTDADVTIRPASRIGAGTILANSPADYHRGTIYMATSAGGYVGLVRLEDGRLDAAAAFDPEFIRQAGSLAIAAIQTLQQAGFPIPAELQTAIWKGTPPLTRQPSRVAGFRWFAVGDAAGYVEPFTGEGMAWAISGAVSLAPIVVQAATSWNSQMEANWTQTHQSRIGQRQSGCRWVARLLRSPLVCRFAVHGLALFPALARPVVRRLNRPTRLNS
jgi:menaquinone-9 beta-reductase